LLTYSSPLQLGPLEAVSDRLRAELNAWVNPINARLLYFKNLQGISDSVKDPDMESSKWRGLLVELEDLRLQESKLFELACYSLLSSEYLLFTLLR